MQIPVRTDTVDSADRGRPITVGVADKQHAALSYAAGEARLVGCDLRVVHAYVVPPGPPAGLGAAYGIDLDGTFRESGHDVLTDAVGYLAPQYDDVVVRFVLEEGPPVQVMTRASETSRLVVLGPDDATPWYSRLFLSRVSRRLADVAACPVVVVPDTWSGARGGGVTLLVDGRTVAHGLLRHAFEQAARHDEALHIVHLQAPDDSRDEAVSWNEMTSLIDLWNAVYPRVRVDTRLVCGVADLETVESYEHTALLVLGRPHEHHVVAAPHRSLAQAVIQRAQCPVAVVPPSYDG
jgi:nucleotide-binding universal stress UspA family protein